MKLYEPLFLILCLQDRLLSINSRLQEKIDRALLALGSLNTISILLPDTSLFLYMYVRKEALLSSQIEGTQSSFSDLLLYESEETPGVPLDDVIEVSNYIAAMEHGIRRIREGFPLSLRLLREIHQVLLAKGRGSEKQPGEFRTSQNWIGGTRPGNADFVPPPKHRVIECMGALENFLHGEPEPFPILVRSALAHVQFETIHPFLDGNGRLGRLLITFLLCKNNVLLEPTLYLSLYFKTHRQEYYDLLQKVRLEGDWESWLAFFVDGVKETSEQAVITAKNLTSLFDDDRKKIQKLGQAAGSALRVHQALQINPIASIAKLASSTTLTVPTVTNSLTRLTKLGIVKELTGAQRGRTFGYSMFIKILSEGTEPL
jgi:cell filamentation protein, protein adenylyltransferase